MKWKRTKEVPSKSGLALFCYHYEGMLLILIFIKSSFYPWRLFSGFGIINNAKKSFPLAGMKYQKNRQLWIWPYHLVEWWKHIRNSRNSDKIKFSLVWFSISTAWKSLYLFMKFGWVKGKWKLRIKLGWICFNQELATVHKYITDKIKS